MCIFCKIVNGELPSYKLYEDELYIAFLDISQATFGHTLVVPKTHYSSIFDLNENTTIFNLVIRLSKAITKSLGLTDVNIINNNGPFSGQTVNHFHIHIIPRTKEDDFSIHFSEHKLTPQAFKSLQNLIIEQIK